MVETFKIKAANAAMKLLWNAAFRPGYTPQSMRRNFEFLTRHGTVDPALKNPEIKSFRKSFKHIPAEIIEPSQNTIATILYLHGGGYFMGSIACYRNFAMTLAEKSNARVILIDYRLAPEYPFPAALDDALVSYLEIRKSYPNEKILIAGDSAGGGLTLATLLTLRDHAQPLPSGGICISSAADLTASGSSFEFNAAKDVWLSKEHIQAWLPWYQGSADPKNPALSPVFGEFTNIPPLFLLVGDQEVLLDDTMTVARKAQSAGVNVRLSTAPQMQHVWMMSAPWLAESKRAMSEIAEFVTSLSG